jgi:Winged helix-turn helix
VPASTTWPARLSGRPRNYTRVIWGGGREHVAGWPHRTLGAATSRQSPFVIDLTDEDRGQLESLVRRGTAEYRMVTRARIVLAAADREENASIAGRLGVALNTVIKWRKRFFVEGMAGLVDRKRSGRPRTFSPSGGG